MFTLSMKHLTVFGSGSFWPLPPEYGTGRYSLYASLLTVFYVFMSWSRRSKGPDVPWRRIWDGGQGATPPPFAFGIPRNWFFLPRTEILYFAKLTILRNWRNGIITQIKVIVRRKKISSDYVFVESYTYLTVLSDLGLFKYNIFMSLLTLPKVKSWNRPWFRSLI